MTTKENCPICGRVLPDSGEYKISKGGQKICQTCNDEVGCKILKEYQWWSNTPVGLRHARIEGKNKTLCGNRLYSISFTTLSGPACEECEKIIVADDMIEVRYNKG